MFTGPGISLGVFPPECLGLRIQDPDLRAGAMTFRSGKWEKDRVMLLPARLQPELERHIAGVRRLFEEDRALR